MKKNTRNIVTLIVILIVLVILYVSAFLFRPSSRQERVESQSVIQGINVDDIFGIDLNKNYQLKKVNSVWIIQKDGDDEGNKSFPADQERVQQFFSILSTFQQGRLISTNPGDLSSYNLNEEVTSLFLTLKNEQEEDVITIRLGVVVGTNSATYMQFVPKTDVFQVKDSINRFLEPDYPFWADLRLYPERYSISEIARYTISSYTDEKIDQTITLEKQEKKWAILNQDDKKIDAVLAEKYIVDIFSLSGRDVSKFTILQETRLVNVKGELNSGSVVLFDLYYFADSYFAKTTGGQDSVVFTLSKEQADMISSVSSEYFVTEENIADGERDPALEKDAFVSEN